MCTRCGDVEPEVQVELDEFLHGPEIKRPRAASRRNPMICASVERFFASDLLSG